MFRARTPKSSSGTPAAAASSRIASAPARLSSGSGSVHSAICLAHDPDTCPRVIASAMTGCRTSRRCQPTAPRAAPSEIPVLPISHCFALRCPSGSYPFPAVNAARTAAFTAVSFVAHATGGPASRHAPTSPAPSSRWRPGDPGRRPACRPPPRRSQRPLPPSGSPPCLSLVSRFLFFPYYTEHSVTIYIAHVSLFESRSKLNSVNSAEPAAMRSRLAFRLTSQQAQKGSKRGPA